MPAVSKGDKILVTGASGFIAVHVCRDLLAKGYKVRGTVRSEEKGEYLKDLLKSSDFEYVLVDDITKEGIFDEAVKGVDAVAHTASPFHFKATHPDQLIHPALKGTTGVLKSIQKNNPSVKRVVITSSVAAVRSPITKANAKHMDENDWNEDSAKECEAKGGDVQPLHSYLASKTLAEKSLWEFIEKEKPSWDAATINPPLVLGEVLQQVDKKESLNTSVAMTAAYLDGSKKESDLPGPLGNWVSVRDVSEGHIRALEVPDAGGNRFIVGAGKLTGQAIVDILHKLYPDAKDVPVGKPGSGPEAEKDMIFFDGSKAEKILGIKYHTLEETLKAQFDSLKKKKLL